MLFLAADAEQVGHLKDMVRSLLAWRSIEADISDLRLNLDALQTKQAAQHREQTAETVLRLVRETYRCVVAPNQGVKPSGELAEIEWEMFAVNPSTPGLGKEVDRVLQENELVIRQWAPIHLHGVLKRWFWRNDVAEVPALDVWQKSCQYLYFPRLASSQVMQAAIAAGAGHRDFFGLAYGKEGDTYRGFSFGKTTSPILDASLLLIEPQAAADYEERTRPAPIPETTEPNSTSTTAATSVVSAPSSNGAAAPATPARQLTHFFGSVEIDPIRASLEFSKVVSELVELFTAQSGTRVRIRVDIEAHDDRGFGEVTVRAARENAKVLGLSSHEFD